MNMFINASCVYLCREKVEYNFPEAWISFFFQLKFNEYVEGTKTWSFFWSFSSKFFLCLVLLQTTFQTKTFFFLFLSSKVRLKVAFGAHYVRFHTL